MKLGILSEIVSGRIFLPPHRRRLIAEDIQIPAKDWTVVPIRPGIKTKLRYQKLELSVPGAWYAFETEDVFLPDGTRFEATVELQDQTGEWHTLLDDGPTFGGHDMDAEAPPARYISFELETYVRTRDLKFVSLRVRSTAPFKCSKIVWHCYNMK